MLLRLFKYSVDIVYKPGPQMHISDALSRAYIQDDSIDKGLVVDMEVMVHNFIKTLPITKGKLLEMQHSTSEDDCLELQKLAKYGWPTSKRHVPEVVRQYWTMRNRIHETEGLLFLVTNSSFRPQ